jgi:hypothetical protein
VILRKAPQDIELLFLEVTIILGIVIIKTIDRARVCFC